MITRDVLSSPVNCYLRPSNCKLTLADFHLDDSYSHFNAIWLINIKLDIDIPDMLLPV
jgi:hypothetical protein